MQINRVNNNNTCNKPSFGMIGKINAGPMTNLENEIISKNLKELKAIAKDVYADIDLGICDPMFRYFDIKVTALDRTGKTFVSNPRTLFTADSPAENITKALFNTLTRARDACLKANKSSNV